MDSELDVSCFLHRKTQETDNMSTKVCAAKTTEELDCEKQLKVSETERKPDVFEVFLPSLWTLRVVGVWLPGDLRRCPGVKESLRGGPKAILYFLFCMVVLVSAGVQSLRFIPYALNQTGVELIMVIIVFVSFFTPVYMFIVVFYLRKSLVDLVKDLKTYYRRYGQRSYVKDMIKNGKRSHIASLILIALCLSGQALYFYEWSTAFHWITTPVGGKAPWYIQVPWKAFLAAGWIISGIAATSYMSFVGLISTILRTEFSEFNKAVQTLMSSLHNYGNRRKITTDCAVPQHCKCGSAQQFRVKPAPQNRGCVEASSQTEGETKGVDEINDELDDLRCRFEDLVELVDKGNKTSNFQLLDVYLICIPFLCLIIKGLTEVRDIKDYIVFMTICLVSICCSVLYFSVVAVQLNMEAHASSQYLLKASMRNLSEKTIQIINLFVYRLNSSPVGLSLLGLVTIDFSFVLALAGTLVGYIFVVLQFNIQSSCPAVPSSEITTAFPLNTTTAPA